MARKHYFLFCYATDEKTGNPSHTRMGEGSTPQEAFKDAFGMIPNEYTEITYKDMGSRSPKYLSQKVKQTFYSKEGWLSFIAPAIKRAREQMEARRAMGDFDTPPGA